MITALANPKRFLDLSRIVSPWTCALAVILLELDDFKAINDSFGCEAGNQILRQVAGRLKNCLAESGISPGKYTVGRTGGGEFVVLLDHGSDDRPERLAEELLLTFSVPLYFGGLQHEIRASVGVVLDNNRERIAEDLIRDGGLAARHARELGKNRWQKFDPEMRERAQARMSITIDLSHAIERGELVPVYQPEVDTATREIVGFECLLRWQGVLRENNSASRQEGELAKETIELRNTTVFCN